MPPFRLPSRLLPVLLLLLTAGCASPYQDRFEPVNREVRAFNDAVDGAVTKPLAQGYAAVLPDVVRTGVSNFYTNLRYPTVPLHQLLQGKPRLALEDTGRFLINSTVGLAGILDPATQMGLVRHREDFGQTFGVWGFPMGDYIVLPIWGGGTTRDLVGDALGAFLYAPRYMGEAEHRVAVIALDVINVRAQVLGQEDLIRGDRYIFLRDSWLQRREYLTKDGEVEDPFLDDF